MGITGKYFALNTEETSHLLAKDGSIDALTLLHDLDEHYQGAWSEHLDKAWNEIHRRLGDGTLDIDYDSPLDKCVLGGRPLWRQGGSVIRSL